MTFTAIDFETANAKRSSACSVGLVFIKDGQVVGELHQLLRPIPHRFDGRNVAIHGIRSADVAGAPTFAEYWPTLSTKIVGPLVAHNASFDMSVLRAALGEFEVSYPSIDYFCTLAISKQTWPEQSSHRLNNLAQRLGIAFQHHDALEDARVCATIALEACKVHGAASLYDLEHRTCRAKSL